MAGDFKVVPLTEIRAFIWFCGTYLTPGKLGYL